MTYMPKLAVYKVALVDERYLLDDDGYLADSRYPADAMVDFRWIIFYSEMR